MKVFLYLVLFLFIQFNTFASIVIAGVETSVSITDSQLDLKFKLKNNDRNFSKENIDLTNYPNSSIEINDLDNREREVIFHISKEDLKNTVLYQNPNMNLPGDRAIPGVVRGKLPAQDVDGEIPSTIRLYCNATVFGVFLPVKSLTGTTIITDKFYNGNTRIGNISLVGKDLNNQNSGVLVLIITSTI